jgi:general L-amino acid transport system permease protein
MASTNVAASSAALPPPRTSTGPIAWIKRNLFATPFDAALTIAVILFLAWVLPPFLRWAVFDATISGETKEACTSGGACWTVIKMRFGQLIYGLYPPESRWRVNLVAVLVVLSLVPLFLPQLKQKLLYGAGVLIVLPVICDFILAGGWGGMQLVETSLWGGLFLTLLISLVGIAASLPIGVLLALGRRSDMPIIKALCVTLIEIVRGVPLITVLFMASVMLPLFFPPGWTIDKLARALIGVSIFSGAYMAEVIRGGLQAIPRGQYEAAKAMGLNYWQSMGLVILPQALRLVIPGIVNTFIGLLKDTSLVLIMGLYDLLGIARMIVASPEWLGKSIETYVAAGFGFWIFCYAMSRYSQRLEKKLQTGHKH